MLVRIDLDTGAREVIADDPQADLENPAISPDGTAVAYTHESLSTPHRAPRITLYCLRFGRDPEPVADSWDRWPSSVTWARDGWGKRAVGAGHFVQMVVPDQVNAMIDRFLELAGVSGGQTVTQ